MERQKRKEGILRFLQSLPHLFLILFLKFTVWGVQLFQIYHNGAIFHCQFIHLKFNCFF